MTKEQARQFCREHGIRFMKPPPTDERAPWTDRIVKEYTWLSTA